MGDVMTASQGNSGAYNRFVIHLGEQHQIEKQYEVSMEKPSGEIVDLLRWIGSHAAGTPITFDEDCRSFYRQYDSQIVEKMKFKDSALAGRLSEQAIRLAAVIALSDRRLIVNKNDLEAAYGIRLSMYRRAREAVDRAGLLTDKSLDNVAVDQITKMFKRREVWRISDFGRYSDAYRKLTVPQQQAVCRQLETNGVYEQDPTGRRGRVISLIFEEME